MEPTDNYTSMDIDIGAVRDIVLSYLLHNCYKETYESLTSDPSACLKPSFNYFIDERKSMFPF